MSWWRSGTSPRRSPAGRMRSLRTRACSSVGDRFAGAVVHQRRHGLPGELLALDRRGLDDGALARAQAVQPRGQERLDRRRDGDRRQLDRRPPVARGQDAIVDQHLDDLDDEQRVALGDVEDARGRAGAEPRRAQQLSQQVGRVPLGQRLEQHRRRVRPPAPQPGRPSSTSGRAVASSSSGASRAQSATCSRKSMNAGSPHCRSSMTSTSGRSRAMASSDLRIAQKASSGATGSPAGFSSSAARGAAGSSAATPSSSPLAPSASMSGHQVRPSP